MGSKQIAYIKQQHRYKHTVIFLRIALFIGFFAAWEICAGIGILNAFIFSSPSRIISALIKMIQENTLFAHMFITIGETLLSFLLILVLGIGFAIILWLSKLVSDVLEPYLVVLNSLPKSALAPVLIVWLGNNPKTIIVTGISVAIFGTIITLYTEFRQTDPEKVKLIQTLGGTKKDLLFKLVLPGSVPAIISTMKVNIGLSLVGVIIGEFLAARKGLGYLIIYGSQTFKMDWVIMSVFILCILAIILYKCINLIEKIINRKMNYNENK
ncbi:MAG: ABC transporter permease [Lachnospiraceae bacterium]